METISIRDIRGERLRETARKGKLLGITNRRALIGVFVPVAPAWVEHLIDYNWSNVQQSVAEGARAMALGKPLADVSDVTSTTEPQAKLVAAVVGESVTATPETEEAIRGLQDVLNPPSPGAEPDRTTSAPSVRTVRIGDLKAGADVIEQAAKARQTLAITHDRELIGIVIPVTPGLVQFLIEQSMSRVLTNIQLAEKQLGAPGKMVILHQAMQSADTGHQP
jgi:hypothetical protein